MQAVFLARMLLVNAMAGIDLSIWYDWRDPIDDTTPTSVFGLVHCRANDTSSADISSGSCQQTTPALDSLGQGWGHPKPSFAAMQTLTTALSGYTFVARIPFGADTAPQVPDTDDQYALLFGRDGGHGSGSDVLARKTNQTDVVVVCYTRARIPERGLLCLPDWLGGTVAFSAQSVVGGDLPVVPTVMHQLNYQQTHATGGHHIKGAVSCTHLDLMLTQSPVYLRPLGP